MVTRFGDRNPVIVGAIGLVVLALAEVPVGRVRVMTRQPDPRLTVL
ncbi:hypothetical protein [Nocardioides eburneiflavus]|nr:hypothetical protein [Nocardioides eburneiflavus]